MTKEKEENLNNDEEINNEIENIEDEGKAEITEKNGVVYEYRENK